MINSDCRQSYIHINHHFLHNVKKFFYKTNLLKTPPSLPPLKQFGWALQNSLSPNVKNKINNINSSNCSPYISYGPRRDNLLKMIKAF